MSVQLASLTDNHIKKKIISVPVDSLKISDFNPRKERSEEDIERLAGRITRNGFEVTRALWAEKNSDSYEIFAGGTRLKAALLAGLAEVPIVLHEGLTEDDKVRLADQDNENDEYHERVNPVDVWANYAWLADKENGMGWTQERIAKAKDVGRTTVTQRLKYNSMSHIVKQIVAQNILTEAHLKGITQLSLKRQFSSWLTTEQAQLELATKAAKDKSKNGFKTVRAVKSDVDQWKAFIKEAETIYQSLSEETTLYLLDQSPPPPFSWNAKAAFVHELALRNARSMVKVKEADQAVRTKIQENLEAYKVYVDKQSAEAARAAIQANKEKKLFDKFICGDCLKLVIPANIHLLLLDPPYGKDYQSNRRWKTSAPNKIKNDTPKEAIKLLASAIENCIPRLKDDSHVLVFCDWFIEPDFRQILEDNGLKVKGSLIWVKEEHSAGDVRGSFGPSHERILHAVKGTPEVTPRIRDVLEFSRTKNTNHPTEKPTGLLKKLIASTTNEGDLVVDVFAGCASTLLAAMELKRDFWGSESNEAYHDEGCIRLLEELNATTTWV